MVSGVMLTPHELYTFEKEFGKPSITPSIIVYLVDNWFNYLY